MRKLLIVLLISGIAISCQENQNDKYKDFYTILDELLRYNYYDADLVILELKKVYSDPIITLDINGDTVNNIPSVPPPGMVHYDKDFFTFLFSQKLIDSMDTEFMFNQIDTIRNFCLNPSNIDRQTLHISELDSLLKEFGVDSTYNYLNVNYNAFSFIEISTPIVSKDGRRFLFDVEYHCGGLCGSGETYLFENRNNKWRIIFSKHNWVS